MGIQGDLIKRVKNGYAIGEVNEGIANLNLPLWGYFRKRNGDIAYLPADPVSLRRSKNKGFVYLGEEPTDEPLDSGIPPAVDWTI